MTNSKAIDKGLKSIEWLDYEENIDDIRKAIDIALKEQAKDIFEDWEMEISRFRLKRTGQQEVSMICRELKKKWLK